MSTITVTFQDDDGEEYTVTFPSKMEVCHECGGEGFVLAEGMRGYAYSAEEFCDSFDPEEREEYFRPGGRYDQTCPVCHGKNVVPVVEEEQLSTEQKEAYRLWCEAQDREAAYRAEERATCRAECGYRD